MARWKDGVGARRWSKRKTICCPLFTNLSRLFTPFSIHHLGGKRGVSDPWSLFSVSLDSWVPRTDVSDHHLCFCFVSPQTTSPPFLKRPYIIFQIEKSQVALLFLKAILFDCCLVVQRYPLSSICGSHIEAPHSCTCVNFFPVLSLKISQS